jgi:putative membrane protein
MPLHSAFFAFLHHIAAFGLVAVLVAQLMFLRAELNIANARRLQVLDMLVGAFAGTLFVVGLLRVFFFEKGSEFYFTNAFFLVKFALFLLTGVLSVVPTLEILRWRKAVREGTAPAVDPGRIRTLRMILHAELGAIVVIILCAALMARGLELFSP